MYKRRIFSLMIAAVLVLQASVPALAYTPALPGTASSVINAAEEYVGMKGLANVREEIKSKGFKSYYPQLVNNWCGWFVTNCGRQAEANIGKGLIVNTFAYNAVDEGAKITFVNKTFYKAKKSNFRSNYAYNANYKPRKGDIIIYSSDGRYWWSHMGLVSANCSKPRTKVKTTPVESDDPVEQDHPAEPVNPSEPERPSEPVALGDENKIESVIE